MENPFTSTVTRRLKQRFRISQISRHVLRRTDRYISSLLLAAMAAPTPIMADPRPQDAGVRI